MANMFGTLNTGYSGLNVNQAAISVTSHNVSNASNENYTRQRAVLETNIPLHTTPGDLGTGAKLQTIVRIKNEFLATRYENSSSDLQYNATKKKYLEEVSTYFPDVDDAGLNKDIKNYFDSWSKFADNPNDGALKIDLASKTQILANNIKDTRTKLTNLDKSINSNIKVNIDEVNRLAKSIADLNKQITSVEANKNNHANDLRDERDKYEKQLTELIHPSISKSGLKSSGNTNNDRADYNEDYNINIAGIPLVDNGTYHPLGIRKNPDSKDGFYSVYFQSQDDNSIKDVTKEITKGKIGALISLRGDSFDKNQEVNNGKITSFKNELDSLSASIIQSTNSIYSYSAQEEAFSDTVSDPVSLSDSEQKIPLSSPSLKDVLHGEVRDGTLKLNLYKPNGDFDKQVEVNIKKDKSLIDARDDINNALGSDGEAYIENGSLKLKGTGDGAVLVKHDGSNLFGAMNEAQYEPISNVNSEDLKLPIKDGSFEVVAYDDDGKELARRKIVVNSESKDPKQSTIAGILAQINMPDVDDNGDNDSSNDVDDYYKADIVGGKIQFTKKDDSKTTYVGLDNDSSNFGGAVGINKFLDGDSAKNISLDSKLADDPSQIHAYKAPSDGNNDVANDMVQLQYNDIEFKLGDNTVKNTISGFYRYTTADVANATKQANNAYDNTNAVFKAIKTEFKNESGVDIDEEMTHLMQYQRGYQASAKVITTINKMLDSLLSLKQ